MKFSEEQKDALATFLLFCFCFVAVLCLDVVSVFCLLTGRQK